jgi:hypothetical protein
MLRHKKGAVPIVPNIPNVPILAAVQGSTVQRFDRSLLLGKINWTGLAIHTAFATGKFKKGGGPAEPSLISAILDY